MSFFRSQGKEKIEESGTRTVYMPVFLPDLPAQLKKEFKLPIDLKQLGPLNDGSLHCIDVRRFIDGPTDYKKIAEFLTNDLKEIDYPVQYDYNTSDSNAARCFQSSWYRYVLGVVFIEVRVKSANMKNIKNEPPYPKYEGRAINKGTVITPEDILGFHKGPCAYNGRDISQMFPQFPDHSKRDIEFLPLIMGVTEALTKEAKSDEGKTMLDFLQTINKLNSGKEFTKEDIQNIEKVRKLTDGKMASGFVVQLDIIMHEMTVKLGMIHAPGGPTTA